ncbi:hypothetical protein CY35_10G027600 [Sphagnum magellanicum]|nr:hypothetical protein CY35_10G027600 [Sphagnum magellanicum]
MTGNAPKEDDDDGLELMSLPDAMKSEAALARDVNYRGHVWQQAVAAAAAPNQQELDSGERRLNELGYKQELRRELTLFKCLAISFSTMTLFTGIVPLYGRSLLYAGPVGMVWGWVVVTFFTWFVGFAMAEICSSFPATGSLYFWAAHLAGPRWGPLASWICAWLGVIGLIARIGTQAYAGTEILQNIILLCTRTNEHAGYFAPPGVFLAIYIALCIIWAMLNTCAINVIAIIDTASIYWQVIGGALLVILLPLVAKTTQPASYVFTHFEIGDATTGVKSGVYAVLLSWLVSQYSLYGFDAAAYLTEETKGADVNGPIAILSSIALISVFGWGILLVLTFSIQVYALSRVGGTPFSKVLRKVHPKLKVPVNAVWICAAFAILLGFPILRISVVFTAISSICTIGWVGGYAVPIFFRMIIAKDKFHPGPFYLGNVGSRWVCAIAFLWICYTCSMFLLPTVYPITFSTFNYAPIALAIVLGAVMSWWAIDARHWFQGPVREISMGEIPDEEH